MDPLDIRPMTRAELDLGIEWAAAEGWNPGLHDADSFFSADPDGFLIGRLAGEPVGMISVVAYGRSFGFLGFYIVRPEWRGRGHGLALWNAGLARLGGRVVGLDGVVAQQANYRRSGFELAWNNVRYQGEARLDPTALAATSPREEPRQPSGAALDDLLEHDAAMFPDDRRAFMRAWLTQRGSVVRSVRRADRVVGFGVIRPCRMGFKIGPLVADDTETAQALFAALALAVPPGAMVQLDVPATNPDAVALARRHGMAPVFETARMYRGAAPVLPLERQFGITTFELG